MDNQEKDKDFSKFFHNVIDSGTWAKWSFKAKAVYAVLNRFAWYDSRKALPAVATIARLAGISEDSVHEGINEIIDSGYADKKRGGIKIGFRNIYTVYKEQQLVLNKLADNILRKKPVKCKTERDPKTGKFISSRKIHGDYSRKKPANDTSRKKDGEKKNDIEILNRDIKVDSTLSCFQNQASLTFSVEAFNGHTIETQSELEILLNKYGKEIIKMIKDGKVKLKEGIQFINKLLE